MSPSDTSPEKPTRRRAAHSRSPASTAPDCEISARSPGTAFRAAKLALSFAARRNDAKAVRSDEAQAVLARLEPCLFGERAGAMAEPGGDDDGAAATPLRPALAMIPGTVAGGVVTIIRSGTCVRSSIRGHARLAVDLAVFRVNEQNRPGKPRLP